MGADEILKIQTILVANGFPVKIDGVMGPKTERAISRFQKWIAPKQPRGKSSCQSGKAKASARRTPT